MEIGKTGRLEGKKGKKLLLSVLPNLQFSQIRYL